MGSCAGGFCHESLDLMIWRCCCNWNKLLTSAKRNNSDQRGSKSVGTRYKNSSLTEWHDTKEEIMGDSGQIASY